MRMGLREANQSFSKAIKAVKAGKDVVLTERGKPIAVIKPLRLDEDMNSILRQLEAEGLLRRGPKSGEPMPAWRALCGSKANPSQKPSVKNETSGEPGLFRRQRSSKKYVREAGSSRVGALLISSHGEGRCPVFSLWTENEPGFRRPPE